MKLGIMQPYFFPYIGYFQLIAAVDCFVIYDNIKYTKKGWINRNRMLINGKDEIFSVSLQSGSDSLDIGERRLDPNFDREKLLNRFRSAYQRAPYFKETYPLVEEVICHDDPNLFGYLRHSLERTCAHIGIRTPFVVSSTTAADHSLKGEERVVAICEALGAKTYINAIGGLSLYSKDTFQSRGITLQFIRSSPFEYPQFGGPFVPWLSIIDVLMFHPLTPAGLDALSYYTLE